MICSKVGLHNYGSGCLSKLIVSDFSLIMSLLIQMNLEVYSLICSSAEVKRKRCRALWERCSGEWHRASQGVPEGRLKGGLDGGYSRRLPSDAHVFFISVKITFK